MDDELLTVPEVLAELRGVSKRTFYRWRELGRAPRCFRLPNGELRVSKGDLKVWLEKHREVAV
ncbi:helix-turn-helix transcriptional regulator [Allorhizocola rhizosphaerae]|uniref:helix-turn-helix transcriptional regulator n=1 Tax=Allorhizocola rhizosphaerae TaxID=1872709 RepID=UPI000E3E2644|nr:helix-turn-helix domain-containing protein [Allorhizocola rhizosphaerae]